jgi:hypothetical protein
MIVSMRLFGVVAEIGKSLCGRFGRPHNWSASFR